jgi:hypothetical protein
MKLAALLLTVLVGIVAGGCDSPVLRPDADRSPFHSVVVRDDTVVATLPEVSQWLVEECSAKPRKTKPGESFVLRAGSSLSLYEHHSSYQITAQIIPTAGLTIESTFDARSFGEGIKKRSFSSMPNDRIRQAEQDALSDGDKHSVFLGFHLAADELDIQRL